MKRFKLSQISVAATRTAKEAIRDNRPVDAVKVIRDDLKTGLAEAYDLYKRLRDETNREDGLGERFS